ncbi:hypothetical protein LZ31DRAFT_553787 [Colletotrichum somersetense]|nr:hypothetical protein LZ31DRAFT_553787 [Colletotrichum somersetense]
MSRLPDSVWLVCMAGASVGLKVNKGDSARGKLWVVLSIVFPRCKPTTVMTAGAEGGHGSSSQYRMAAMGQNR